MVPVYSLLLFGGQLEVLHDKGLLQVDGWAQFKAPGRIGVLVRELRAQVGAGRRLPVDVQCLGLLPAALCAALPVAQPPTR